MNPWLVSFWVVLWAGLIALAIGTLFAWILVRYEFRGKWLLEGAIMAPMVFPPTLLGYYLLLLLGQRGLGPVIESLLNTRIVFSITGAILVASVTAIPLVTQTMQVSLSQINPEIYEAAHVDGATCGHLFWRISLPLSWRGLISGGVLGALRALGEFGATLMVAGNIPGRTQTVPMAIYDAVQANDLARANQYALLLTLLAFGLLFVVLRLRSQAEK